MQAEIDFPIDLWKDISPEGLDLTMKMTERDQYKRLSARDCLKHPWFFLTPIKTKLKNVLYNLKTFGYDHIELSQRNISLEKGINFTTSSPLFLKKPTPDTTSKTSFSDLQMDSPLLIDNNTLTMRTTFPLYPSERKLERANTNHINNPFFNMMDEESKELRHTSEDPSDDEIPSELEENNKRSLTPKMNIEHCLEFVGSSEGMSKRIFERSNLKKQNLTPKISRNRFNNNESFDAEESILPYIINNPEETPRGDILMRKSKSISISNKYST